MEFQYDLELNKIESMIKNKNIKRILIQMPEGMLDTPLKSIITKFSDSNIEIFLAGDASYGICDIAIEKAKFLDCDLLIHFGHTDFAFADRIHSTVEGINILIIPALVTFNISSSLNNIKNKLDELGWRKVIITATAQHLNNLKELKTFLEKQKIIVSNETQIIGCHIGSLRTPTQNDGIISLHAGEFHTRGLLLNSSIPVLQVNPYTSNISYYSSDERERIIKQRLNVITKVKSAQYWGIISSSKIGQYNPTNIESIRQKLSNAKKRHLIVIAENIDTQVLFNMTWVDAWVNTACPRLIDDQERFFKPIITFKEFLYLFGDVTWENLLEKGFI